MNSRELCWLKSLAALCLSDPSNPVTGGSGVTTRDFERFVGQEPPDGVVALGQLSDGGYVRQTHMTLAFNKPGPPVWELTAQGWKEVLGA